MPLLFKQSLRSMISPSPIFSLLSSGHFPVYPCFLAEQHLNLQQLQCLRNYYPIRKESYFTRLAGIIPFVQPSMMLAFSAVAWHCWLIFSWGSLLILWSLSEALLLIFFFPCLYFCILLFLLSEAVFLPTNCHLFFLDYFSNWPNRYRFQCSPTYL